MMDRSDYRRSTKYFIDLPGLSTVQPLSASIDSTYALIPVDTTTAAAVVPRRGEDHPPLDAVVFFTNCLLFEHELPAFVTPSPRRALVRPLLRKRGVPPNQSYFDDVAMAYEALISMRFGLGLVDFRYETLLDEVDLPFTKRYGRVLQELSLYSSALRQLDPLSEFLGYYRVLESTTGTNAKRWVSANLVRLSTYDYGWLGMGSFISDRPKKNVFNAYRRRALQRVSGLKASRPGLNVSDYLYSEVRCGIAHGAHSVKVSDYGHTIEEVARDVMIVKLLARIAILDKAGLPNGRVV